jgi:hypothetical protein
MIDRFVCGLKREKRLLSEDKKLTFSKAVEITQGLLKLSTSSVRKAACIASVCNNLMFTVQIQHLWHLTILIPKNKWY